MAGSKVVDLGLVEARRLTRLRPGDPVQPGFKGDRLVSPGAPPQLLPPEVASRVRGVSRRLLNDTLAQAVGFASRR